MARKLEQAQPSAGETPAEDALAVMNPDAPVEIAGRAITVREYGFFEGLEVAHRAAAFIADMHAMCSDGDLRYARIRRLFGVHESVVVAIAAQSADVEPEWVRGLSPADAELFLSTWFAVNSGFFVHEVVVEMREERQRQQMNATGSMPSSSSPTPASETSTSLGDTPSAS